jgi:hypothetical protein
MILAASDLGMPAECTDKGPGERICEVTLDPFLCGYDLHAGPCPHSQLDARRAEAVRSACCVGFVADP